MPNKDGTGPEGAGPRTGNRLGNCQPKEGELPIVARQCCGNHHRHGKCKKNH